MTKIKEKKKRGANISIWIAQEMIDEIERIADKAKLTRSGLIQNFLDVGVKEIKVQKALFIVKMSLKLMDIKEQWTKALAESKKGKEKPKRGINVSVWLDQELTEEIEELAEKLGYSRSKLIEKIMKMSLSDIKILEKTGVLKITVIMLDLKEKWKKVFRETEKSIKDKEIKL